MPRMREQSAVTLGWEEGCGFLDLFEFLSFEVSLSHRPGPYLHTASRVVVGECWGWKMALGIRDILRPSHA